MTIDELKHSGWIMFECISGSKAYGLDVPGSDTDIKGVFVLPQDRIYGLDYIAQISNQSNDIVYYELGRFIELLIKNNPNILEMLAVSDEDILYKDPLWDKIRNAPVLSKLCKNTFAGYAFTQIKKAKGLNKKIFNPIDRKRKTVTDFCYILQGKGSVPFNTWLTETGTSAESCGLAKIPHIKGVYGLYKDIQTPYGGIVRDSECGDVRLSSIPEGCVPEAFLFFNKEAYAAHCKEYKAYWDWVEKRNPARFENTLAHGKNYDAKNMMHTFRLLRMAEEILSEGKIIVKRPDREFLLRVRNGEFEYEDLIKMAEEAVEKISELEKVSDLPDVPDKENLINLLLRVRKEWYKRYD
ncbi:hypothetical protein FUAX_17380 [Fulvitalea axinellae]|uniref:Nucleotidyltransferase n=1 Tax=Fulvitalea axinellae TaxID=1182444 RepID=A0AAU9CAW0_9BACT|nr:hypothetical protein FUAX_17380 [Fulvitalea axinellae]